MAKPPSKAPGGTVTDPCTSTLVPSDCSRAPAMEPQGWSGSGWCGCASARPQGKTKATLSSDRRTERFMVLSSSTRGDDGARGMSSASRAAVPNELLAVRLEVLGRAGEHLLPRRRVLALALASCWALWAPARGAAGKCQETQLEQARSVHFPPSVQYTPTCSLRGIMRVDA